MNENSESAAEPVEGGPAEPSKIPQRANGIPLPLMIAWLVLFAWIAVYAIEYMIPALPR